ncbi:MAG TPA: hypothetical protein VKZ49_19510 [Polyangiaceae bacterium]|nr:hypothetical protein [Polyangiaceae bacterium]
MKAPLVWLCWLGAMLASRPALAAEPCAVVVLRPSHATLEAWVAGMQAVVAELSISGCEVLVRSAAAGDLDGLLAELSTAVASQGAVGGVAVMREGRTGVAYVTTARGLDRAEAEIDAGSIAEGTVSLRVLQLLRVRTLDIPRAQAPQPQPAGPEAPHEGAASDRTAGWVLPWVGLGTTASSQATRLPFVVLLGARLRLSGRLGADATLGTTMSALGLETPAGRVLIDWWQSTLHATFALVERPRLEVAVGLGGGVLWASETARAREGFVATDDSTTVGLVSARAVGAWRAGRFTLMVIAEPGVLLPALSVRAAGEEVARVGRPWLSLAGGAGWQF